MNLSSSPPLTLPRFYVLLALAQSELHGYAIQGSIYNLSRGSIHIKNGSLYPLLAGMSEEGFIDIVSHESGRASNRPKIVYCLAPHGLLALKADLNRLRHAIKVADAARLQPNPTELSLDIHKILL